MRVLVLRALIGVWLVIAVSSLASAQRDVPLSTQLYVDRQVAAQTSARDAALAQIRQDVALISKTARDAADEVKEMRLAVWGCAGTILISLFMQVIEIRRKRNADDAK